MKFRTVDVVLLECLTSLKKTERFLIRCIEFVGKNFVKSTAISTNEWKKNCSRQ